MAKSSKSKASRPRSWEKEKKQRTARVDESALEPLMAEQRRLHQLLMAGMVLMCTGVAAGLFLGDSGIARAAVVLFGGGSIVTMIFLRRRLEMKCVRAGMTRMELDARVAYRKYLRTGPTPAQRSQSAVGKRWVARVLTLVSAVTVGSAVAVFMLTSGTPGQEATAQLAFGVGFVSFFTTFLFVALVSSYTRRIRLAQIELSGRTPFS